MMKKMVASLLVAGSLTMATSGMAGAVATPSCANSASTLSVLQAQEAKVGAALAALEAQESQVPWLKWPIAALTRREAFLAAQVTALEARCPQGGVGVTLIG